MNRSEIIAGLLLCLLGGMLTGAGIAIGGISIFLVIGVPIGFLGGWIFSEGVSQ